MKTIKHFTKNMNLVYFFNLKKIILNIFYLNKENFCVCKLTNQKMEANFPVKA